MPAAPSKRRPRARGLPRNPQPIRARSQRPVAPAGRLGVEQIDRRHLELRRDRLGRDRRLRRLARRFRQASASPALISAATTASLANAAHAATIMRAAPICAWAVGPLRAWARATAGRSTSTASATSLDRHRPDLVRASPTVQWKGRPLLWQLQAFLRGCGRTVQHPPERLDRILQADRGWLYRDRRRRRFRPTVRIAARSDETAANALARARLRLHRDRTESEWLGRVELEGGRRQILSGKLGDTIASFGNGYPSRCRPSSARAAGAERFALRRAAQAWTSSPK